MRHLSFQRSEKDRLSVGKKINNYKGVKRALLQRSAQAAGVIAVASVGVFSAGEAKSATVSPGFDLFFTPFASFAQPGSPVIPFESYAEKIGEGQGCGDNSFNFNDGNGCVPTGNTDTIVERKLQADAPPGDMDKIEIEMVALSLRSVDPIGLFGVNEIIGARLLRDLNTGNYVYGDAHPTIPISTMEIKFDDANSGEWSSMLNFVVELYGFDTGQTLLKEIEFESPSAPWERGPVPEPAIPGINYLLNGVDTSTDFFTPGLVIHDDGKGVVHHIVPTPLPASLSLMFGVFAFFGGLAGWRRRKSA